VDLSRRTVLLLGAGAAVTSVPALHLVSRELETNRATSSVVEPNRQVPVDAVWLHPDGVDANPGTRAKPRFTPVEGRYHVCAGGTYAGWTFKPRAGTSTTIAAVPGQRPVFSGGDTLTRAIEASGQVFVYDVTFDAYAPTGPKSSYTSAAVYLGGTSAGSILDGVTMSRSRMGHLSVAVGDVTVRNTHLVDAGHYGMLATNADRLLVEDVTMARLNRGGYDPQTQAAAGSKVTWSDSVTYRRVHVEDAPGAYGLWWDASCTRTRVIEPSVVGSGVGGRAPMVHCLQLEKSDGGLYDGVQQYAYVVGGSTEGARGAGVKILSSGHVKVWGGEHHRNGWADVVVQQDASERGPTALDPRNRDPRTSPWSAVGVELANVSLDRLWVYDDGRRAFSPEQMVTRIAGLQITSPTIRWGTTANLTPRQVAKRLGRGYSAASPPVPADVAALLSS
jgi:hypothetical protein